MEHFSTKAIEWLSQSRWVTLWLLLLLSYFGGAIKNLFSPTKKTRLREKLENVKAEYNELLGRYNRLVTMINTKGGMSFLDGNTSQFSSSEIKNLVKLCHPDKHGGSILAKDMTARLLELR